jgi:hypothetical protein
MKIFLINHIKKNATLFLITVTILASSLSDNCIIAQNNKYVIGSIPEKGFVPNKETAIKIAIAVWLPIYGKKIYNEAPYQVELIDNKIWLVQGTLPKGKLGGVAIIKIQKKDGKILMVAHEK